MRQSHEAIRPCCHSPEPIGRRHRRGRALLVLLAVNTASGGTTKEVLTIGATRRRSARGHPVGHHRGLSDPPLRGEVVRIPGINVYATPVQNLRIGGRSSRAEFQFVMQSLDRAQLYEWSQKIADAMGRDPRFADVNSDLQINATEATLVINKDKANSLGISAEKLRSTLYSGFGSRQVSTIYKTGDTFSVIMEFSDKANWTPAILPDVRIRNDRGKLVPIGTFARVERTAGSLTINQLGQLPAITISFNLPRNVSLGDAVARIEQLKAELELPQGITTTYSGTPRPIKILLPTKASCCLLRWLQSISFWVFSTKATSIPLRS